MIYWISYKGHEIKSEGRKKKFDNNIYTFDIETTSYIILDDMQLETDKYLSLSDKEKERCKFYATMYIWMFGINETVYYGRTYEELNEFLHNIEKYTASQNIKKFIYVHNLSFEFQFLRNIFKFKNILARKSRKVMKCELEDLNFEFRCSLYMTNCKLEKLPKVYNLDVEKLVGNLDYNKLRHSGTRLTKKELAYCENDCLVVYKYIQRELEQYDKTKQIPLTSTGHVRREFKDIITKNYKYRNKTRNSINTDGHIYNLLTETFMGGYTHANWIYADTIINDVSSYDFTSSYPYVMVTHKFPMSRFRICYIKKDSQMIDCFAYLLVVRFKNIKCKYYNNFISASKCRYITHGRYDNGRLISADEIEMCLTDIDFKFILQSYDCEYEILESYYSRYGYLPKDFITFILQKYILKTTYKGVKDKELEYNLEKAKFNSLYGMCVTNNIKDNVEYDNDSGWQEVPQTNEEIMNALEKEEKQGFLSFSWGVWVTAHARNNLLQNVIKLDTFVIYCDTDSIKVREGFDKNVIEDYNKHVINLLNKASKDLEIPIDNFMPEDVKGNKRPLGVFDHDDEYKEFITQGAKKYAYIDKKYGEIHITVSGVPKKGAKALKNLSEFRDNFIFNYEDTGKLLLSYNDEQCEFELIDYEGKKKKVNDKYACCLVPTTYELGKSLEYAHLISDESSKRSIYRE